MSDNISEGPPRAKGLSRFTGIFTRRAPQVANTPEVVAQERQLPKDLFQLNEAETQRARSIVLNPESVNPQYLVGQDESIVRFTGTMQQFADFITKTQQEPLRRVDDEPYSEPSSYPAILRRTGIEVIDSFPAPRNQVLDYPRDATEAPVRAEVLGIHSGEDWSRVALMRGKNYDFPLDYRLQRRVRDMGEVLYTSTSDSFYTGYPDELRVQERKPSPDQEIINSALRLSFWTLKSGPQQTSSELNNIVVPASMTANLAPAPVAATTS